MSKQKNIDLDEMAEIFKALSNPNRLRILKQLMTCCRPGTKGLVDADSSAPVGELGRSLDIVPSTVSHHIKELRHAGLIRTRREGQKIECWLDPDVLKAIQAFFSF